MLGVQASDWFISNEHARLLNMAPRSPYVENLLSLPFVKRANLSIEPSRRQPHNHTVLELVTPQGRRRLVVEEKRSHLSQASVGDLIARWRAKLPMPLILFAPYVSREMGTALVSHGINFVDRGGNCHVNLGGSYVAHVEGRKLRQTPGARSGVRGPGFRLMFALLVDPGLINAPVRELARVSGVSVGTASTVLRRLEQDGVLVRTRTKRHLVRPKDLVERWIAGYSETLRPQLFLGRFRTPDRDPHSLEVRIAEILGRDGAWAWGGAAGAFRLTKHYRSDETILHVRAAASDLPKRLRALPHSAGPLTVLGVPGPLAFRGVAPHTVHPVLIYAELVLTGSDRATEAASEIRERFLNPK